LLALIFVPVHKQGNVPYELKIKSIVVRDFLWAVQVLDICL
jgi:hypothetical protein